MFICFANFCQCFIQGINKIVALLNSLLKTTRLSDLALKAFKAGKNKVLSNSNGKTYKIVVNLSKNNKSRKLTHVTNIKTTEKPNLLTPNNKKTFNQLQLVFIKALIFRYFNLKSYIQIEIDVSGYAIGRILS